MNSNSYTVVLTNDNSQREISQTSHQANLNAQFRTALLELLWNEVLFHLALLANAEKKRSWFWSSRPLQKDLDYHTATNDRDDKITQFSTVLTQLRQHGQYQDFSDRVTALLKIVSNPDSDPVKAVRDIILISQQKDTSGPDIILNNLCHMLIEKNERQVRIKALEEELDIANIPGSLSERKQAELSRLGAKYLAMLATNFELPVLESNELQQENREQLSIDLPASVRLAIGEMYGFSSAHDASSQNYKVELLAYLKSTGTTKSSFFGLFNSSEYNRVVKILENAEQTPQTNDVCADALNRIDRLKQQKLAKEPNNSDKISNDIQKIQDAFQENRRALCLEKIKEMAVDADEVNSSESNDVDRLHTLLQYQKFINQQRKTEATVGQMQGNVIAEPKDLGLVRSGLAKFKRNNDDHYEPFLPFCFAGSSSDELQMNIKSGRYASFLEKIKPLSESTSFYTLILIISAALFRASPKESSYLQLRALLDAVFKNQYLTVVGKIRENLRGTQFEWLSEYRLEDLTFPSSDSEVTEVQKALLDQEGIFPPLKSNNTESVASEEDKLWSTALLTKAQKVIAGNMFDTQYKTIDTFSVANLKNYSKANRDILAAYTLCEWYQTTSKAAGNVGVHFGEILIRLRMAVIGEEMDFPTADIESLKRKCVVRKGKSLDRLFIAIQSNQGSSMSIGSRSDISSFSPSIVLRGMTTFSGASSMSSGDNAVTVCPI